MSLIIMFVSPSLFLKVNIIYYIKMALIHNIAKTLIKDIILIDRVKKTGKTDRKR
jgi:hypothetical protein